MANKTAQYWGTGRRKTAVARVRLVPGTGKVTINDRSLTDYVGGREPLMAQNLNLPFVATNNLGNYDVYANVFGGGVVSQIGAIRLGVARALLRLDPEFRTMLRGEGLLTRDPRAKEREKYGRKRARKRFQFSKR